MHEGRVRGSVAQEVLRTAGCDVVVVKDHGLPGDVGEVLAGVSPGIRTARIESDGVGGAFEEQAHTSDLMLVGASRDWMVRRTLLGEFTDALANRVRPTLIMIRPHETRPVSVWRRVVGLQRRGGTPS